MFNLDKCFSVTGHIKILVERDNVTKCVHEQNNLITSAFPRFLGCHGYRGAQWGGLQQLLVGDGSDAPSASDTALTHQLWSIDRTASLAKMSFNDPIDIISVQFGYIIPATSSYVGTIREIGLQGRANGGGYLATHALLKDSEGNPYELVKTDLDQVTILYTVTIHVNLTQDYAWFFTPALFAANYGISFLFAGDDRWNSDWQAFGVCLSRRYFKKHGNGIIARDMNVDTYLDTIAGANYDVSTNLQTFPRRRFNKDNGAVNGHYINFITLGCNPGGSYGPIFGTPLLKFLFDLTKSSIFTPTQLPARPVGTGDGETVSFKPPLNFWVEDTDVIEIDGVHKTRGVDYTIDHYNNVDFLVELLPSSHLFVYDGYFSGQESNHNTFDNLMLCASDSVKINGQLPYLKSTKITFGQGSHTAQTIQYVDNKMYYMEMPIDTLGLDWSVDEVYMILNHNYSHTASIAIDYSFDGETYTEAASFSLSNKSGYALSDWSKISLERSVIARYWRMRIGNNSRSGGNIGLMLRKACSNIVFTNPPADGALITLAATVDRPYKDADHVLDISASIQY